MLQTWLTAFTTWPLWLRQVLLVVFYFVLAWILHRLTHRSTPFIFRITRRLSGNKRISAERQNTLDGLVASAISFLLFAAAALFSLAIFARTDTILWLVGLFAAAFGLGARPLVSDVLTGIFFLFGDAFNIGEKVEIHSGAQEIQGIIEDVQLQHTRLRSHTGELYVVPNGEIRVIRNFSRGHFSTADIQLKLNSAELDAALPLLETLGQQLANELDAVPLPWRIISKGGVVGAHTELTILIRTEYGQAAELRPYLSAQIRDMLDKHNIELHN